MVTGGQARPPRTLDFGFIKYAKSYEMLFSEPVKHVMVKNGDFRPYALIFESRISFIDKDGKVISEAPLPPTERIRSSESANNRYFSLYGNVENSDRGFFRLYNDKGELLLSRDDFVYNDRIPAPLPLEKSNRLISARDGILVVTNLDGDTLISKTLLSKDSLHDGDILIALRGEKDEFAVVANKFQIPSGKESDKPILYHFDPNLEILEQDTLPYLLVTGISFTRDCKYMQIQAELDSGKNQKIVGKTYPSPDDEPISFDNTTIIRIASTSENSPISEKSGKTDTKSKQLAKGDLLLRAVSKGRAELLVSPDWKPLNAISLPLPAYPWVDGALDSHGQYALLYNDDELALLEIKSGQVSRIPFPYSFKRCFISSGGKRVVLTGEFGFVIYELSR
jgi:hypothetical protein